MASKGKAVVLGAGATGLATAWKLGETGYDAEVLELAGEIGGASRTFQWDEFLVDTGPHKFYTHLPGILDEVKALLGDELITMPKQTSIFLRGKLLDYPFRFTQLLMKLSPLFGLHVGMSFAYSAVTERNRPDVSYEDWIVKRFGWHMYRSTFQSLAQKIWCDPRELSADLARRRIVTPGLIALVRRVLFGQKDKQAPAPFFYYPKMGISRLCERMRDKIEEKGGKVLIKQKLEKLKIEGGRVKTAIVGSAEGKREIPLECFVSTIPMNRLFDLLEPAPPKAVMDAANALKIKPIMLAFIAFKKPRMFKDVWIFFPDRKVLFNRISEQKGFSEVMGPPDKTVVCFDITAGHMPEAWHWPAEKVLARCLEDLRDCGLYHGEEVTAQELFKIPSIYPLYTKGYRENLLACLDYVESIPNLFTTGRSGLFCYNNTDQCLDMGFRLAKHISSDGTREGLRKLLEYYDGYEIVD